MHEEDDIEFAVHAIRIIANFYSVKLTDKRLFDDYSFNYNVDKTNIDTKTIFTNYTFNKYTQIIEELKKKLQSPKMYENYKKKGNFKKHIYTQSFKIYIDFLHKLEGMYLERDKYLEFGWKINEIDKFAQAFIYMFNEMGFDINKIPWIYIESTTTTNLKQSFTKGSDDAKDDEAVFIEIMGNTFNKLLCNMNF